MQQLPPSLERAWRKLRQHFQHARAFNVLYLFCSEPKLLALLQARCAEYLQLHVRTQSIIKPTDIAGLSESLALVLESANDHGARAVRAPVWLDWSAFGSVDNEPALAAALTKLNASRSALETRFQRLLIVALPEHSMRVLGAAAPDMWHIRTLTETLVSSPDELASWLDSQARPTPLAETHDGVTLLEADYPTTYRLWLEAQSLATTDEARAQLPLWVADQAIRELLTQGALAQAADVAEDMRDIAQSRQNTRDLSVSWEKLGDIAHARDRLDGADSAYRESKTLRDTLYRAQATPENTRDLSVSWNKLGDIAYARGRLDEADSAYRESKTLRDTLYRAQATPENTRDLSVSWNKLGDIAHARGRLDEARVAYRAACALWQQLQASAGEQRDTLRGEAIVLERLASVLSEPEQQNERRAALAAAAQHWLRLATAFSDESEFAESLVRVRALLDALDATD